MVQSRAGAGGTVQLALRLPQELRDRIKAAADAGGRSINSELVAALEEAYPGPDPDDDEAGDMVPIMSERELLQFRASIDKAIAVTRAAAKRKKSG